MIDWLSRLWSRPVPARWVVVDVETSGLQASDQLLSIGAVAVENGRICLSDSLDLVLRQTNTSSIQNILVHGIGGQAQLQGTDPEQACTTFLDYVRSSPLIAFHAGFDRGFLARAIKHYLNLPLGNAWLDLAQLAPALHPEVHAETLDDWLAVYGIEPVARHTAAGDALSTAQLLLRLMADAGPKRGRDFVQLQRAAAQARWLQGSARRH
jgi:DNA polymerase-3 subunit epsilon